MLFSAIKVEGREELAVRHRFKSVSGAADVPLLPESAVQSDAKGNYVFIVGKDNKVERRAIKTGEVSDRGVTVASGLSGNERVVLSAGAFLSPGQKVKPILRKP